MKYLLVLVFFISLKSFAFSHSHQKFDAILSEIIFTDGKQSLVNYSKLIDSPAKLNAYLKELSLVTKKEFHTFSKDERLAFLINSYNAFTLKLIIDHFPVKSIKDIGSLFQSPWKKDFFYFLGEKSHLDKIEHEMIRKVFKEPRIHFAVNCASIGCPSLMEKAFTGKNLENELEKMTKNFLSNPLKNKINTKEKIIYLSKIFDWYEKDFNDKGGVLKFVAKYLSTDLKTKSQIENGEYRIEYLDYDWKLNSTP